MHRTGPQTHVVLHPGGQRSGFPRGIGQAEVASGAGRRRHLPDSAASNHARADRAPRPDMSTSPSDSRRYALRAICRSAPGQVAAIAAWIERQRGYVQAFAIHDDRPTGRFFVRAVFQRAGAVAGDLPRLREGWRRLAPGLQALHWRLHDQTQPLRVLPMVSRLDHCLIDLVDSDWVAGIRMCGDEFPRSPSREPTSTAVAPQRFHDWKELRGEPTFDLGRTKHRRACAPRGSRQPAGTACSVRGRRTSHRVRTTRYSARTSSLRPSQTICTPRQSRMKADRRKNTTVPVSPRAAAAAPRSGRLGTSPRRSR